MNRKRDIRVLVADDSLVAREAICSYLETLDGITIVGAARNGFDLLQKAESLQPDLVLTDLCMPRMSGIECTLRLHGILPTVRIIVFTELDGPLTREACIDAGADGYLHKSQLPEDLVLEIHRLFPKALA
jgi:DNA-binding NarL/FixJ family response regulator